MTSLSSRIFGCIAKAKKCPTRHLCLILLLLPIVASGTESVLSGNNLRRVDEIYDSPSLRQNIEVTSPPALPTWKQKHQSSPNSSPSPASDQDQTNEPSYSPTNLTEPPAADVDGSFDELDSTDFPTSSPIAEQVAITDFPTSSPIAESGDSFDEADTTDYPTYFPTLAPTANPVKSQSDDYYEKLENLDPELFDDAPTEEPVSSDNKSSDDKSEIDEIKEKVLEGEKEIVRVAKDPTAEVLAGVIALFGLLGMVFTGWQLLENPQGLCASICRLVVTCFACFLKVIFLPCRLCCDRHRGYSGSNTMDNSSFLTNEHTHDLELS